MAPAAPLGLRPRPRSFPPPGFWAKGEVGPAGEEKGVPSRRGIWLTLSAIIDGTLNPVFEGASPSGRHPSPSVLGKPGNPPQIDRSGSYSGYSWDCSDWTSQADCNRLSGCLWLVSTGTCMVGRRTCETLSSSECATAESIGLSCSWKMGCDGSPTPCTTIKEAGSCSRMEGCVWTLNE